ncbi:DUF6708 domain-containing protein [uncultured Shewanella sp.]|uniref:DUF6708 domain-containing protein n=1 Tax=uncultured Shewanella sp. TaxID=173975 RepID=UPI00261A03B8|nr:DUF6708 domain-containing protein [uncultured Shewanella sp.]
MFQLFKKKKSKKDDRSLTTELTPHPNTRPSAGDVKNQGTSQSLFISPLPLPTGAEAADHNGSFIEVNEAYLDVGSSNHGKAFQVQAAVFIMTLIMIVNICLLSLIFYKEISRPIQPMSELDARFERKLFGSSASDLNITLTREPSQVLITLLSKEGAGIFATWLLLAGLCIYSIVDTTLKKARQRPLRFHRQRREVCFFNEGSDRPIICPWEDVVAWVSTSTGTNGANVMQTHTFGMAFEDKAADKYWFFTQGVPMPSMGLTQWEAIRAYMESGIEALPDYVVKRIGEYEGLHSFKANRERQYYSFAHSPKFWFKVRMLDFSESYLGMGLNFIWNVMCWWKFPYWVAEWDHKYSMKAMPSTIDDWSKPLPESEWAKPSALSVKHTKALTQYLSEGGEFMDYCKERLQPDLHAAMRAENKAQSDNASKTDNKEDKIA